MPHEFHIAMKEARVASPYPYRPDFSRVVGLSDSGYKKIEAGDRVPEVETLHNIIKFGCIPSEVGDALMVLRNAAYAEKMGVQLVAGPQVDVHKLATKIVTEVAFTLRRGNQRITRAQQTTLINRIEILLRSALEK